jgi:hypothetical protein
MHTQKVFHYTSVNSLALILQSQKIRFTRLDKFDDVMEAQTHGGIGFGKYFFASCWTQDATESIPQWHMYGDRMEGVRIELPIRPFRRVRLESIPGITIEPGFEAISPLTSRELFGTNYVLLAGMMTFNEEFFQGPVTYVPDVAARWAAAVTRTPNYSGFGTPGFRVDKAYDLVRLKSQTWAFQAEYRFFLFALPMFPLFESDGTNLPTLDQLNSAGEALQRNVDPIATYIDVPLDPGSLDYLVVRTGPLITESNRARVEAILREFAPNAVIVSSALYNTIRHPQRGG